ncbi:hypothetical protein, partial [Streptococcus varani]
ENDGWEAFLFCPNLSIFTTFRIIIPKIQKKTNLKNEVCLQSETVQSLFFSLKSAKLIKRPKPTQSIYLRTVK